MNYLKSLRTKAKISQGEVAEKLKYGSGQFISNWERGVSVPPRKSLPILAKLYDVALSDLNDHCYQIELKKINKKWGK